MQIFKALQIIAGVLAFATTPVVAEEAASSVRIVVTTMGTYERGYHLNQQLTTRDFFAFGKEELESEFVIKKTDPNALAIATRMMGITGVDTVSIRRYSLQIEIGKAFDWEAIEVAVIQALKDELKVAEFSVDRSDLEKTASRGGCHRMGLRRQHVDPPNKVIIHTSPAKHRDFRSGL